MNIPENLRYSTDHEWIRVEGDFGFIGITEFASHELGDIVYLEVETLDEDIMMDGVFGSIEAVKTVSDLLMPVSGKVLEVNGLLETNPETINTDPYGNGWIIKINILDPSQIDGLMDAAAYAKFIAG
ncbi:MAG: glycine cleavage system protein H [Bacteroidetes bacterium CG2_30_33_31]|nr:MAG: glycine cleavage system protein H [Bacteroidetes bacterium CG2_30_33_31]